MDLQTIRDSLKREPFLPFDLCLADGQRITVKHPEFVAMSKRIVVVTNNEGQIKFVEPLLIVSLDHHKPKTNGRSNGRSRKADP